MAYNIGEDIPISTLHESVLAVVDDFKYIGSHLSLCESDVCVRKAQAGELSTAWTILKSFTSNQLKRRLWVVKVESVFWAYAKLDPNLREGDKSGQMIHRDDALIKDGNECYT